MRGPYCHLSGQSEAQIGVIKLGAEWSWLVTGLPSDYGPEQIDIVRPGSGFTNILDFRKASVFCASAPDLGNECIWKPATRLTATRKY